MIEGSPIARHFERIYASAFMFNAQQEAVGPALAINYTSKTQYLFRINKWTLDEWDNSGINAVQADRDRAVPFERIAFFGDGLTDIPVMRVMIDHGGHPVAVYDHETPITKAAADKLLKDGRARLAAGGDYREGVRTRHHRRRPAWPDGPRRPRRTVRLALVVEPAQDHRRQARQILRDQARPV